MGIAMEHTMESKARSDWDWDTVSRRISETARVAVSLHIDGCVRDAENAEKLVRGTQAEGLLAWVRASDEARRQRGLTSGGVGR
jgi:hypothetical protein